MGAFKSLLRRGKKDRNGTAKEMFSAVGKRSDISNLPIAPRSKPTDRFGYSRLLGEGDFLPPQCNDPFLLYPFFRYLRDYIPDVSAGIWAWVRTCSTPQRVEYETGSEEEVRLAKAVVADLDSRIYEYDHMKHQGMDALVNAFFLSVFTYGAFAGEVALRNDRSGIDRFFLIDPATIRFRRLQGSRRLVPYQFTPDNKTIRLDAASFFYYGLDADIDSPYGRSPLLALPFVAKVQQQLLSDMGRAMHNAGWPTLHVRYTPPEREPGESLTEYRDRVVNNYQAIKNNIAEKETDSNYITYNNIEIEYLGPGGEVAHRWDLSLQAINEQVIAALHLAPFMIGRNWGTTETWGTAQYQLIVNNAVSVQRGAKRMCEWLRNLELALHGIPVRTRHTFQPHSALSTWESARARNLDVQSVLRLHEQDLVSDEEARTLVEKWL